ncbi:hypothetical protein EJB05_03084, partial [Eragrostis curvula]
MSQEATPTGPADSTVTTAASGIYPSSSSSSDDDDGSSLSDSDSDYELILDDLVEEEIEAEMMEQLLRAAGASRAELRQVAAYREEARVQAEAFRRKVAAHRKAMRKMRRGRCRGHLPAGRCTRRKKDKAEGKSSNKSVKDGDKTNKKRKNYLMLAQHMSWSAKEFVDLLKTDISGYTDAQRAEYFRALDRRSNQLPGGSGGV